MAQETPSSIMWPRSWFAASWLLQLFVRVQMQPWQLPKRLRLPCIMPDCQWSDVSGFLAVTHISFLLFQVFTAQAECFEHTIQIISNYEKAFKFSLGSLKSKLLAWNKPLVLQIYLRPSFSLQCCCVRAVRGSSSTGGYWGFPLACASATGDFAFNCQKKSG